MIGGFALELIDFPKDAQASERAEKTVKGLLIINGPLYIEIFAVGIFFMGMYQLNEKRQKEILTVLAERCAENQ